MKMLMTALVVLLGFYAGFLEVKQNPHRYPVFTTMGPR